MLNAQSVLTGIAYISLHICLQVTDAVFIECNGYVYQRKKLTCFSAGALNWLDVSTNTVAQY